MPFIENKIKNDYNKFKRLVVHLYMSDNIPSTLNRCSLSKENYIIRIKVIKYEIKLTIRPILIRTILK